MGRTIAGLAIVAWLIAGAVGAQEPVQVIDDEHLLALITKANSDYRANLRGVACREEIEFVQLDAGGGIKRQTRYEFDYSLPVDARRPVAVIEIRHPVGQTPKNFEPRQSVRDLNWRDLLRIFEPAYRDSYVFGSNGEKTVEGRRVWVVQFRPVVAFDASFERLLDGYSVHVPLGGQALVDARTFHILSLELHGMGLPASRTFPVAKRIDFLSYAVSADLAEVELGGKRRYLPKLIRSELDTSEGRIIEERRYSNYRLLD